MASCKCYLDESARPRAFCVSCYVESAQAFATVAGPADRPAYDADCPSCLRHLPHSLVAHETALRRNYEASLP